MSRRISLTTRWSSAGGGRAGRWLQRELVKCGKPHCSKDRDGAGHGPYWYLYYTNQRGKYTSRYVGKSLTPELADEFGVPWSG